MMTTMTTLRSRLLQALTLGASALFAAGAHAVNDLPAGGRRLLQTADGYVATVVNGVVTRRDGVDTGARPGRLVRA
jgi:N-acyl-D-aspartate/D-glutamate deacylase